MSGGGWSGAKGAATEGPGKHKGGQFGREVAQEAAMVHKAVHVVLMIVIHSLADVQLI